MNYWTDRIEFKRQIDGKLYPLLKKFIGKPLLDSVLIQVKDEVSDWLDSIKSKFDCSIVFEIEKNDIIKFIRVIPTDTI